MADMLQKNFVDEGYEATVANNGLDAVKCFSTGMYDLCILDVMMPKMDGLQVAKEIRRMDPSIGFLFLTAKSSLQDKQAGFDAGCDDFLTKPFEFEELALRVRAILQRTHGPKLHGLGSLAYGNFELHWRERILEVENQRIPLTGKEVQILYLLLTNAGQLVERTTIVEHVWGRMDEYHSRSLDVYLSKLRKYIRLIPGAELHNVYGKGFKIELVDSTR